MAKQCIAVIAGAEEEQELQGLAAFLGDARKEEGPAGCVFNGFCGRSTGCGYALWYW